nr:hypothetical protein [Tanacetum cinerariifolium]
MAVVEVPQTLEYRGGQLNVAPVPEDFQDSHDDEEDTKGSHEYLNDLEEEYQERALLAKSKIFLKKCTKRFSSAKATDQTKFHKYGKEKHKPELRPTKDFEAKYDKVKAKLALLSSSASASKAAIVKSEGLIAEAYEWDKEEVSSNDNEMVEVKELMALAEENDAISKEGAKNGEWVKISMRKDVRSSQEYMNDLEEEYQARALLAKSKRFLKKGTQRFSGAKATYQIECHKCGRKGHFARDYFSKTSVPSYQSHFQKNLLHLSEYKPKLKHTKDFESKYNKVKAKLALLSSGALVPKSSSGKNKGLIIETYEWNVEEVSSDEETEVKALVALSSEERVSVDKESAKNGEWVKISIQKVPLDESQRNTSDLLVVDSSTTDYDSADKSLVCSTSLPPLEKLVGAEPVSGPKTIKSILKSNSTFKAKTLKSVIINKPSSVPAKGNISTLVSKTNVDLAGKLKNVKMEDDLTLAIIMKELNELKLKIIKNKSSYSRNKNYQPVPLNTLRNKYKTQFKMNCKLCG